MSAFRISGSGLVLFYVVVLGVTCHAAAAHSSGWYALGDALLQIRFAPVWRVEKAVHFESEWYTVAAGREKLLLVYLGNNPDLASIAHDAVRRRSLNGNDAREYYSRGTLTDVLVTPRCGHEKYVWMKKLVKQSRFNPDIDAAMRSLRCSAVSKP